jgi:hypothetical protein
VGSGPATIGGIRLGRSTTTALNYLLYAASGTFYLINGTGGADPQLMSLNSIDVNFNVPIRGATFSSTAGQITVQKSSYVGSDSGTVRIVGADVLNTQYNSDIRANASAAADTTHTLPAVTGTLLNTASSYVSGICGATGNISFVAGSNMTITRSGSTFTFAASGGGTASVIDIASSNVNATRYLVFAGGSGATGLAIDDVTTPLTYTPLGGNIGAKKVTLTTSSNVITIDSGIPSVVFTDGADIATFGLNSVSANTTIPFEISNTPAGLSFIGTSTFDNSVTFLSGASAANLYVGSGATFASAVVSDGGFRITSNAINAQTDSYSLQASDNGKIVTVNAATVKTITVPSGLAVGFNCTVIRVGAGRVAFSASGTTINSVDGLLEIASQHGAASLLSYASNTFNLSGNLA